MGALGEHSIFSLEYISTGELILLLTLLFADILGLTIIIIITIMSIIEFWPRKNIINQDSDDFRNWLPLPPSSSYLDMEDNFHKKLKEAREQAELMWKEEEKKRLSDTWIVIE